MISEPPEKKTPLGQMCHTRETANLHLLVCSTAVRVTQVRKNPWECRTAPDSKHFCPSPITHRVANLSQLPPFQQLLNNVLQNEIFRRIWVNNASTNQDRQPHIHHLLMFSLEPDQSGRHKINDKEPDRFIVKNMITYHSLPLVLS